MENGVCGIKQSIYEANICLKLSVELHGNLVALQQPNCCFLTRKTQKDHYIENLASKKSHVTIFGV